MLRTHVDEQTDTRTHTHSIPRPLHISVNPSRQSVLRGSGCCRLMVIAKTGGGWRGARDVDRQVEGRRDGGMDSSCLPTSPCSARCVTLCQHFVLCIANDGSSLPPLLSFDLSVSLSSGLSAESQTNEILPEVDGRMVRGARPLSACLFVKKSHKP